MKNKEIQPFITTSTRNVIYKISYITGQSLRQICNDLCYHTLSNKEKLVEELSPFLKWNIKIKNNVYSPTNEPIKDYPLSGSLERVAVKIDLSSYDFTKGLAYSLGWSIPKVIAYCIERSMNDFYFINRYIQTNMDENQKAILKEVMKEINESLNQELSITALLFDIVDEKPSDQNFDEALYELAEKW